MCLALGLFPGHAVSFLYLSYELLAAAVDDVKVVVGQLAPLLLHLSIKLLPLAFYLISQFIL